MLRVVGNTDNLEPAALYLYRDWLPASGDIRLIGIDSGRRLCILISFQGDPRQGAEKPLDHGLP